ncbi:MAG: hypothetical protein ACRD6B_12340 [Bryobacteraceae bacterium]
MPRLRYIPNPGDPLRVRELAAIGLSDADIACQLRLSLPKLQKKFKLELQSGAAEGREQALRKLHTIALSGENVSALTFWVKARCGWRDTGTTQSAPQVIRHLTAFMQEPEPSAPAIRNPETEPEA